MRIAVIGSINVDLMYKIEKKIDDGETMFAKQYDILDGGKGANQAVMLSALSDNTVFLGAIGNDSFSMNSIKNLEDKNLDINDIVIKDGNTGLAIIEVFNNNNTIVVFPGVNMMLSKEDVDKFLEKYQDIEVMVLQLEIKMDVVEHIVNSCYSKNIMIILNPAPATSLSSEVIEKIDYLIPNETETIHIFGNDNYEELVKKYKGKLIITLGEEGVMFYNGKTSERIEAKKIVVSDTTGAGDSFVAGFAKSISKKIPLKESIENGIYIASLACLCFGAQTAYEVVKRGKYEKTWNN